MLVELSRRFCRWFSIVISFVDSFDSRGLGSSFVGSSLSLKFFRMEFAGKERG